MSAAVTPGEWYDTLLSRVLGRHFDSITAKSSSCSSGASQTVDHHGHVGPPILSGGRCKRIDKIKEVRKQSSQAMLICLMHALVQTNKSNSA